MIAPPLPIFWLIAAYIIGSCPTGYLLGKWLMGIDIREHGSGNPGATNVFRVVGKRAGIITLVVDFLKGFLPVFLSLTLDPRAQAFASLLGLAAIAGHNWSIWLKFNGGKGVATSAGVFMALLPIPTALSLVVFGIASRLSGHISVGSMAGALSNPLFALLFRSTGYRIFLSLCCALLIILMHRKNIVRLMRSEEMKVFKDKDEGTSSGNKS